MVLSLSGIYLHGLIPLGIRPCSYHAGSFIVAIFIPFITIKSFKLIIKKYII